jgi:hypothetical protein
MQTLAEQELDEIGAILCLSSRFLTRKGGWRYWRAGQLGVDWSRRLAKSDTDAAAVFR